MHNSSAVGNKRARYSHLLRTRPCSSNWTKRFIAGEWWRDFEQGGVQILIDQRSGFSSVLERLPDACVLFCGGRSWLLERYIEVF